MSAGSKTTYTVGRAVKEAAEDARRQMLEITSRTLGCAPEDLELVDGEARVIAHLRIPVGVSKKALLNRLVVTSGRLSRSASTQRKAIWTSRQPRATGKCGW